MPDIYFVIEEWIPPEYAIGGKGYWTRINDDDCTPWRTHSDRIAQDAIQKVLGQNRKARLVKVTEEVL